MVVEHQLPHPSAPPHFSEFDVATLVREVALHLFARSSEIKDSLLQLTSHPSLLHNPDIDDLVTLEFENGKIFLIYRYSSISTKTKLTVL